MAVGWYAVKSRPQQERLALKDLGERFGIAGFLPLRRERYVRRGAVHLRDTPLFPTYLFVNGDLGLNEVWRRVLSGLAVVRVLGGSRPVPTEESQIEKLIARCEEGGGALDLEAEDESRILFEKDDEVRVVSGSFTSFTGTVSEQDLERKTLKLFLSLFGRQTVVEVRHEQVVPLALADEARPLTMCRSAAAFARYDKVVRGMARR